MWMEKHPHGEQADGSLDEISKESNASNSPLEMLKSKLPEGEAISTHQQLEYELGDSL